LVTGCSPSGQWRLLTQLLTKLVGVWIAFGALVIIILVLSLAFVLWAIV
jgi:hypothetical protein